MRIFDWVYIGLLLAASALQWWDKVSSHTGGFASRYSAIILAVILIISVVANRQQKPILKRLAWRALFWCVCSLSTALLILAVGLLIRQGVEVIKLVGLITAMITILIPGLITLYHYSAANNPIWTK